MGVRAAILRDVEVRDLLGTPSRATSTPRPTACRPGRLGRRCQAALADWRAGRTAGGLGRDHDRSARAFARLVGVRPATSRSAPRLGAARPRRGGAARRAPACSPPEGDVHVAALPVARPGRTRRRGADRAARPARRGRRRADDARRLQPRPVAPRGSRRLDAIARPQRHHGALTPWTDAGAAAGCRSTPRASTRRRARLQVADVAARDGVHVGPRARGSSAIAPDAGRRFAGEAAPALLRPAAAAGRPRAPASTPRRRGSRWIAAVHALELLEGSASSASTSTTSGSRTASARASGCRPATPPIVSRRGSRRGRTPRARGDPARAVRAGRLRLSCHIDTDRSTTSTPR